MPLQRKPQFAFYVPTLGTGQSLEMESAAVEAADVFRKSRRVCMGGAYRAVQLTRAFVEAKPHRSRILKPMLLSDFTASIAG